MTNELTHLDLYSGIGGFSFGLEAAGFRTIAFAELDPEASIVLDYYWPGVPNLRDVRTITAGSCERPFIITGGVPCQPASLLGQRRGTTDERWLWPDTIRILRELRPRYAIFENPPALLVLEDGRAWNGIVSGMVASGYDMWWDVFPAAAFGAGHLRERVILVIADAHGREDRKRVGARQEPNGSRHDRPGANQARGSGSPKCSATDADNINGWSGTRGRNGAQANHGHVEGVAPHSNSQRRAEAGQRVLEGTPRGHDVREQSAAHDSGIVTDPNSPRLQGHAGNGANGEGRTRARRPVAPPDLRGRVIGPEWWHEINTGIPVLADGLPSRLVEAVSRCIGNSIIPQIPFLIGQAINEIERSAA